MALLLHDWYRASDHEYTMITMSKLELSSNFVRFSICFDKKMSKNYTKF